tara:strand:- start:287 stop:439 length:153 start_codon:yes stop_codon:yes gene_type:complete
MTKKDLKTLIKIADHVLREQPIWLADSLKIHDDEIKRLRKQLLWDKVANE